MPNDWILWLRRVLLAAFALAVVVGAIIYGAALMASTWFTFWLSAFIGTGVLFAAALWLDRRNAKPNQHVRVVVQNVVIAVGLIVAIAGGFYGIGIEPLLHKAGTTATASLVAMGFLAVGILVGFLFGLPKAVETPVQPPTPVPPATSTPPAGGAPSPPPPQQAAPYVARLQVNTNLEKVSDWLTTVITGLALTQLVKIPVYIGELTKFISGGLVNGTGAAVPTATSDALAVTALGIALHFPLVGFLLGYILTRLILTRAFDEADRSLYTPEEKSKVDRTPVLLEDPGFGRPAPPGNREAAQRILAAANPTQFVTAEDKATYAQALTALGYFKAAITWFQQALALDPDNARLLEQYAAALYADEDSKAWQIIPPLERALELSQNNPTAYGRIATSLTVAYLYVEPDGFLHALEIADTIIGDRNVDKSPELFFYRACALGQLYSAVKGGRTFTQPGIPTTLAEIGKQLESDTRIALTMRPWLAERFKAVTSHALRQANEVSEDDLAGYVDDHPEYVAMLDAPEIVASKTVCVVG